MATTLPVVQQQGGIESITQLLAALGPLLGSGTTKAGSSATTSSDPTDANALIAQILASVDPGNLDVLEGNVLKRASQEFGPSRIASNAAGVRSYSDTTRIQLQNEAMARATGEAMAARLQATNAAQRTAAGLVDAKMQANKTTTQQQQQRTGPNRAGNLLSLALPAAMIYNKIGRTPRSAQPFTAPESSVPSQDFQMTESPDLIASQQSSFADTGDAFYVGDSGSEVPELFSFEQGAFVGDLDIADAGFDPGALDTVDQFSEAGDAAAVFEGFENFDIAEDIFDFGEFLPFEGFADGGIIQPGRRPLPTAAYTSGAAAARTRSGPVVRQSLSRTTPISAQTSTQAATLAKRRPARINEEGIDIESEGPDANPVEPTEALGPNIADTLTSLGIGPVNLGLNIMKTAMGVPPVDALISIGRIATLNKAVDFFQELGFTPQTINPQTIETIGPIATAKLAEEMGIDISPEDVETIGPIGVDKMIQESLGLTGGGVGSSMPAADSGMGVAGFGGSEDQGPTAAGTESGFGGPSDGGTSESATGEAGGGSSDDSGDGDSGESGGGGGTFNKGGKVKGTKTESKGIDKKLIRVTPGEMIIPVDTVEILGEDFFQQLIDATHNAVGRR